MKSSGKGSKQNTSVKSTKTYKARMECLNIRCKHGNNLMSATEPVCRYYRVDYEQGKQVCLQCFVDFKEYLEDLEKRNEKRTVDNPVNDNGIHHIKSSNSNKIMIKSKPSNSSENLHCKPDSDNNDVENAIKVYVERTKNILDNQKQLCNDKSVERYKMTANEVNNIILRIKSDIKITNNLLNDLYRPNVTYLNSVDICESNNTIEPKLYINDLHLNTIEKRTNNECGTDNNATTIKRTSMDTSPFIPADKNLVYPLVSQGLELYGMKFNLLEPWYKCEVQCLISNDYIFIKFEPEEMVLNKTQLAYTMEHPVQFSVGARVISKLSNKDFSNYYSGLIGEPPSTLNNFRYLMFFDNGTIQYQNHKDIRLIIKTSDPVWPMVHPDLQEFIRNYLTEYPNCKMLNLTNKQYVKVQYKNIWETAKVVEVDASLVKLYYPSSKHSEWLYRGSLRFFEIYTTTQEKFKNGVQCVKCETENESPVEITKNKPSVKITKTEPSVKITKNKPSVTITKNEPSVKTTKNEPSVKTTRNEPSVKTKKNEPSVKTTKNGASVKITKNLASVKTMKNVAVKSTTAKGLIKKPQTNGNTESTTTKSTTMTLTTMKLITMKSTTMKSTTMKSTTTNHSTVKSTTTKRTTVKSTTAKNIMSKCTRNNNSSATVSMIYKALPEPIIKPKDFVAHSCGYHCVSWTGYQRNSTTQKISMLVIPLYFGFTRNSIYLGDDKVIFYKTPCGLTIRTAEEMFNYLNLTESQLTIDQFDFSSCVKPFDEVRSLNSFRSLIDISQGKEPIMIPCTNSVNIKLPPQIEYVIARRAMPGVNLNLDSNFLCGCDCTDNCQDKTKCACWKMTIEGQNILPGPANPNIGYNYRRLYESVLTGIYECNDMCKCSRSCLNRVVQNPLSLKLQLFMTDKKGWGVRCLNDIPKGSFICIYVGHLYTEKDANEGGKIDGDEYLAELDYIEVLERVKEGYEENVPAYDLDIDVTKSEENSYVDKSSDEDFESTPLVKCNTGVSDFTLELRKREIKTKGVDSRFHVKSKVNLLPPTKSTRKYFGEEESVYIIDSNTCGNIGRFLNHSCEPNIFVQNVFVDTHDLRFPWVSYFALDYIKAGTELTWDYGYDVGCVPGKVMQCYCESLNCKGRLL